MGEEDWKKALLPGIALAAILALGALFFTVNNVPEQAGSFEDSVENECILVYGNQECVDGRIVIPFFNRGEKTVSRVKITLPVQGGNDLFEINFPLAPKTGKSATLSECGKATGKPLSLFWCCEKCYSTEMDSPSEDVSLGG